MRFADAWLKGSGSQKDGRHLSSLKSVCLRFLEHKTAGPVGFLPRFLLFARLNLLILTLPFRLRRAPGKTVLMLNVLPSAHAQRSYFLSRFLQDCPPADKIGSYSPLAFKDRLVHDGITAKQWGQLLRACRLIWWSGCMDLFSKHPIKCYWHLLASQMLLQQLLFNGKDRRVVLFFAFYPQTFLSAFAASAIADDYHPIIVSSNSILFENNRYLHLPQADLKVCSKVLVPETQSYQKMGWMTLRSVELWGLEEVDRLDTIPVSAPSIDIGLYSSGFWARTANGWRVGDLDRIRAGEFVENRWYQVFAGMLQTVAELKQAHPQLRVKVYLHPYERHLHKQHGIDPPYLGLVRENGFEIEFEGKDSLTLFYEPKIGLSSQSTIVFDRLHYGLEAFYYSGKEDWMPINAAYLGEYRNNGFQDLGELRKKLEACLSA
jgi:hypothetical protein